MKGPELITQNRIQGALRALGYISFHIPNMGYYNKRTGRYNIPTSAYFVPGIPDVVVLLPESKVLWIEVKSKTGTRSPAQELMAKVLVDRGHNYVLARSVPDVMSWLKANGYKYGELA